METILNLLQVFKPENLSITFLAQCLLWNLTKISSLLTFSTVQWMPKQ
jgi:hypothetical protein